ncbi:MAG: sugar ABC transporter permease [Deltaproteobacteria bacterium]|nr:sugar ABC transporter permease [Deltaproteobacteria bacterium]
MNTRNTTNHAKRNLMGDIKRHRAFYALLILPVGYFFIFKYLPIWNGQIAFKDFMPLDGVWGSRWIGFDNFTAFFRSFYFTELLRNTLVLQFHEALCQCTPFDHPGCGLVRERQATVLQAGPDHDLPAPLPVLGHSLRYIAGAAGTRVMGVINDIIKFLGGKPVDFLTNTRTFPWIVILSDAWKEMGWGAIIFIAALMGIDSSLFEAAAVEGTTRHPAGLVHPTLPSIRPVIFMVVLLRLGTILDAGFNQMFMLYSIPVFSVADIIDTWVYRQGLLEFRFGLATAVGLFKGVIGMLLLVFANTLVRRVSDTSII